MNHLESIFFYLFSALAVITAACVVLSRKIIYGVLSLALGMIALSGLFALLGAHFVAVIQVLIYAGAILVLFLFVIMLMGMEGRELRPTFQNPAFWIGASLIVAFLIPFLGLLASLQNGTGWSELSGTVENIGKALFSNFLFHFELISGVLLAGIFGVVGLNRRERRK